MMRKKNSLKGLKQRICIKWRQLMIRYLIRHGKNDTTRRGGEYGL